MNKKLFSIPTTLFIIVLIPHALAEPTNPVVVLETGQGNIVIEFFPEKAPNHVDNFLKLAEDGFYDQTYFHRIIPGFMIQGGDPKSSTTGVPFSEWGTGDPGYSIDAEFNDISHERGIVSMARGTDPNSAGSQFFIVHADSTFLDGQYTVFGRIITQESFEVLDKIAALETFPQESPSADLPIQTSQAILLKATVKDRSEISSILDLQDPIRTDIPMFSIEPEVYTNNYLGISFKSPVGWLIQTPTKTTPNVPDLVILGPQTSFSSPAISITIDKTSGTLDDEIMKLAEAVSPLIQQDVLTIMDEGEMTVDGKKAFVVRATGLFENTNDVVRQVGFATILFVDDDRAYTIQYTNHQSDWREHESAVNLVLDSFEIIHSGPDSTTNSEIAIENNDTETSGGGCLIATAAFGSEIAPQVQFLRELRDNTVLQTQSGTAFMAGFNQIYYSFSPQIADYERENPIFKEAVKVTLTPLLTSLTLLNHVDVDSEQEMLGYGIGIILLNIGMYFVAPAAAIIAIKNRIKQQ